MKRFNDEGKWLYELAGYRIVACPSCAKPINFANYRLVCTACGYNKVYDETKYWQQANLQTYLQTTCCGERLWVINIPHLDFLEQYVQAGLRERVPGINRSLASRLPQWIKNKKNREPILHTLAKLRQRLADEGYQPFIPVEES